MCLSHSSASVPTVSPTTSSSSSSSANGYHPWKLQCLGVPSASSCIAETYTAGCMSLCTCTCETPTGPRTRAYQILPPPTKAALLASDATYFRGACRRIPHALSHGHRQPSCTIYENKRAPPSSGHAWHPPGWRQPRVSCSALSPFSCFLWRTLCACRSDQASFKGLNCCLNMAIMERQRSARISRHNGSPRNQPPVSSPTDSRSPRARPRQQRPIGDVLKIADSLDLMRQGACNGGRPPVRRAATRPRSF